MQRRRGITPEPGSGGAVWARLCRGRSGSSQQLTRSTSEQSLELCHWAFGSGQMRQLRRGWGLLLLPAGENASRRLFAGQFHN